MLFVACCAIFVTSAQQRAGQKREKESYGFLRIIHHHYKYCVHNILVSLVLIQVPGMIPVSSPPLCLIAPTKEVHIQK